MLRSCTLAALLLAASCKGCDEPTKQGLDAAIEAATPSPSVSVAHDGAPPEASSKATSRDTIDEPQPHGDAGPSSCRLVYGPAEQPFHGPASLAIVGQELQLVANDAGKPRVYPVTIPPLPAKNAAAIVPPSPTGVPAAMRWPACELAGRFAYCQAPGGAIVRSTLGGTDTKTVGKSRSGTRIAAAPLGADHSVVAFLDVRRTSEGDMLQAFVALDDREPVKLSEDGAGATTLRILPRGDAPVAIYLDSRSAMVPVHARPMSLRGAELALGNDAVIFVGGAPERGIDFAVSSVGTKSFAFIPMPRDTMDFGMATILIEDPPKDDVPAVWSPYPNGADPAPIAAAPARDGKGAWIVRLRPREKAPTAPRILELGRISAASAFTSYGEIALGRGVREISLIEDAAGSVWILYGDLSITLLERRVCG